MAQAAHPAVRKRSERGTGRREEMLSMKTQASRKENESDAVKNVIGQPMDDHGVKNPVFCQADPTYS